MRQVPKTCILVQSQAQKQLDQCKDTPNDQMGSECADKKLDFWETRDIFP